MTRFESAKEIYASYGVDVEAAMKKCMEAPVSLHCWQGDDVIGFDLTAPLPEESRQPATIPARQKRLSS